MELRPTFPVTTSRLRLRPLSVADAEAVFAYRSLPEVCRLIGFTPAGVPDVIAKLRGGWSRRTIVTEGDALILGVELAGEVIGDMMLALHSVEHRGGEIGWVLAPGHQGRGYAAEAAHAVLHLGFDGLGLHRVIARIDARNASSLRLGDRLGMRREAYLVANEWFKGAWSDEVGLALLAAEWEAQHAGGPGACPWPLAA